MRLLVVGAGSTGGYFGGRLAQAGRSVTFLVRPSRAKALRESGLQIVSPHGDASVVPDLVLPGEIRGTYDAVLLAVKTFQLDEAIDAFAPALGPDSMVLPVLNGMRHMDVLTERLGSQHVAGCALKVATILDGAGRIVQLAPMQDLAYGELSGEATGRIQELDAFMRGAGFDARLTPFIRREMWEKWILLATLGGLTCLMRGTIGDIEAAPGGAALALRFLDEVVAIVRAVGEPPSEQFVGTARQVLTAKGSALVSSMYRDLQNGRPVEVDGIIGDLVRRGRAAELSTPLLDAAYTHLGLYQRRVTGS